MNPLYATDVLIEDLITATYGSNISERKKHVFREALRGLVRLANAEQMLAMKNNIKQLTRISCEDAHSR